MAKRGQSRHLQCIEWTIQQSQSYNILHILLDHTIHCTYHRKLDGSLNALEMTEAATFSHILGLGKSIQMYCILLESCISQCSSQIIYLIQYWTVCCTCHRKMDGSLNAPEMTRVAAFSHIFGLRMSMEMSCILLESCISPLSGHIIYPI